MCKIFVSLKSSSYLCNIKIRTKSALRSTVKREFMKIKTSKYNEVRLSDVAQYIKIPAQIVKPATPNGVLICEVHYEDGKNERVYSDYEVRINNVQLPFAAGEDSYFNREIEIN